MNDRVLRIMARHRQRFADGGDVDNPSDYGDTFAGAAPAPNWGEKLRTVGELMTGIPFAGGNLDRKDYQTWPERMIRSGVSLPHDVMTGQVNPMDPEQTDNVIGRTQDLAGLVMGGGLPAAAKAGVARNALGTGPVPRDAPVANPFYSTLDRAVAEKGPNSAPPDQWLNTLRNAPGVKGEELDWRQVPSFLKSQEGNVTKDALQKHLEDNQVQLNEVNKADESKNFKVSYDPDSKSWDLIDKRNGTVASGGHHTQDEAIRAFEDLKDTNSNMPRYQDYQLPGGDNYREMLLALPPKKDIAPELRSAANEVIRKGTNGQSGVQSWGSGWNPVEVGKKWLNEGKIDQEEFKSLTDYEKSLKATLPSYHSSHWDEPNPLVHVRMNDRTIDGQKALHLEELQSDWHQQGRKQGYRGINADTKNLDVPEGVNAAADPRFWDKSENGVPNAPFKTTWPDLALKRMIRHAAENGYDSLSWTPGEAQAARYDLSKHVDKLTYDPEKQHFRGWKNGEVILRQEVPKEKLADHIGKDAAQKLLDQPVKKDPAFKGATDSPVHSIEGQDLKVGGEGMKAFYDKMLVDKANALGKKYGAKVQKNSEGFPTLPITPALRKKAMEEGFPMFMHGNPFAAPGQQPQQKAGGGQVLDFPGGKADSLTGGGADPFDGGSMPYSVPKASGLIHSPVAGRTDRLPMGVKPSSYIFPADVVSAIGEGNSISGAGALDKLFKSGSNNQRLKGTKKTAKSIRQRFADGGEVSSPPVDIIAAGGEYILDPEDVAKVGYGDIDKGHEILDEMVKQVRKKNISTLQSLPGPKGG